MLGRKERELVLGKAENIGNFIPQRGTGEWVSRKVKYDLVRCSVNLLDFSPGGDFFIKEIGDRDREFIEGFQNRLDEGYKIYSFNIDGSFVYILLKYAG